MQLPCIRAISLGDEVNRLRSVAYGQVQTHFDVLTLLQMLSRCLVFRHISVTVLYKDDCNVTIAPTLNDSSTFLNDSSTFFSSLAYFDGFWTSAVRITFATFTTVRNHRMRVNTCYWAADVYKLCGRLSLEMRVYQFYRLYVY
jgi:hypothetical protein